MLCSFHLVPPFLIVSPIISFLATANTKPVIIIQVLFCTKNEIYSKQFMPKFHNFTGGKFGLRIKWITRKTKTPFKLKDKCVHPACKICHGVCSCRGTYIKETIRNVATRWNEHNMPSEKSNLSKHLYRNITHHFSWSVICNAPVKKLTRKILESNFIALLKPTLNDQIESDLLHLFKNGIT